MAQKYLDSAGLTYFWGKIKSYVQNYASNTEPLMDGTAAVGTENSYARGDHRHPSDTSKVDANAAITGATKTKITYDSKGLVTAGADLAASDIPNLTLSKITDVTATATELNVLDGITATTADLNKTSGIAAGAEVNQNAFSNIKVGTTTIAADTKTDTLEIAAAANNVVSITPDATNDKVTISVDTDLSKYDNTTSGFITSADLVQPSTSTPLMDGTAAVGTATTYARGDHRHPSDTSKVDANTEITGGTKTKITYDSKGLVTAGADLTASDIPNLTLSKITDVTATATELNVLDGITATTADLNKTSSIAAGAEVNQNAFSNIKVGTTTITADTKTDTLEIVAGDNITLTPDATNDKVTITATNNTYTPASATPLMDGTAAVGTSEKYAREDHVHPSDTSKVSTTTTVNGHALSSNVTVTKSDVGLGNVTNDAQIPLSQKGAASGVCPLNASSKIDSTYLPSYVDDVVEAYARTGQTALSSTWLATGSASGTVITPAAGVIYILMADSGDYSANTQFRWGASEYVKLNDGGVSAITNAEIDTIAV